MKRLIHPFIVVCLSILVPFSCFEKTKIEEKEEEQKPLDTSLPPGFNILSKVAPKNLNSAGNGFSTSHASSQSGKFNWAEVKAGFVNPITLNSKKYYLPTKEEWCAIIPSDLCIKFYGNTYFENIESVSIRGRVKGVATTKNYKAKYVLSEGKVYALRLKTHSGSHDDDMFSAFRYEYTSNPDNPSEYGLKISCIHLGYILGNTKIETISKEEYWNSSNPKVVTIFLPAAGMIDASGTPKNVGANGYYWCNFKDEPPTIRTVPHLFFEPNIANTHNVGLKEEKHTIRLFEQID